MTSNLREELKVEYTTLQSQYEAFDGRALLIKSWSAPLLAGGVGLGAEKHSVALIVTLIGASLCLWILEAIWKTFQYCYTDRIKLIEAWFREPPSQEVAPFQIFTAWVELWHRYYRNPKSWIPIVLQPFVWIPYLPIVAMGGRYLLCRTGRTLICPMADRPYRRRNMITARARSRSYADACRAASRGSG